MVILPFLVFAVDSMKNVNDSSMQSEKSRVENGQDLLGLENVRKGLNLVSYAAVLCLVTQRSSPRTFVGRSVA